MGHWNPFKLKDLIPKRVKGFKDTSLGYVSTKRSGEKIKNMLENRWNLFLKDQCLFTKHMPLSYIAIFFGGSTSLRVLQMHPFHYSSSKPAMCEKERGLKSIKKVRPLSKIIEITGQGLGNIKGKWYVKVQTICWKHFFSVLKCERRCFFLLWNTNDIVDWSTWKQNTQTILSWKGYYFLKTFKLKKSDKLGIHKQHPVL